MKAHVHTALSNIIGTVAWLILDGEEMINHGRAEAGPYTDCLIGNGVEITDRLVGNGVEMAVNRAMRHNQTINSR